MAYGDPRHTYEPHLGHGLMHDPFNAIVGPRPIGWVSTVDAEGRFNLAPYSFFNAFNYRPPIVGFCSLGWKDSVANAQRTGEFVWNLVTRELAERMNQTAASVPPEVDEFALAGLTPADSLSVSAPRVLESPVNFECRVTEILQLHTAAGATLETWLTFGEVVRVHIDPDLLEDGLYQTPAAVPVLRGGGPADYFEVTQAARFRMSRPK